MRWLLPAVVVAACVASLSATPAIGQSSASSPVSIDVQVSNLPNDFTVRYVANNTEAVPVSVTSATDLERLARQRCGYISPTFLSIVGELNRTNQVLLRAQIAQGSVKSILIPRCLQFIPAQYVGVATDKFDVLVARMGLAPEALVDVAGKPDRAVIKALAQAISKLTNSQLNYEPPVTEAADKPLLWNDGDELLLPINNLNATTTNLVLRGSPGIAKVNEIRETILALLDGYEGITRQNLSKGSIDAGVINRKASKKGASTPRNRAADSLQPVDFPPCSSSDTTDSHLDDATLGQILKYLSLPYVIRQSALPPGQRQPIHRALIAIVDGGLFDLEEHFRQFIDTRNDEEPDRDRDENDVFGERGGANYEFKPVFEALQHVGKPDHGTHVASIALGGPALVGGGGASIELRKNFGRALGFAGDIYPISAEIFCIDPEGALPGAAAPLTSVHRASRWLTGDGGGGRRRNPPSVVNVSVVDVCGEPLERRIRQRLESTLVVAAAGNHQENLDNRDLEDVPNFCPGLLSRRVPNVLSVTMADVRRDAQNKESVTVHVKANSGLSSVDMAARAQCVPGLVRKDRVERYSGTSQAAPQVSFTAAVLSLIMSPTSPERLKTRLLVGGDFHPGLEAQVRSSSVLNPVKTISIFHDVIVLKSGKVHRGFISEEGDDYAKPICNTRLGPLSLKGALKFAFADAAVPPAPGGWALRKSNEARAVEIQPCDPVTTDYKILFDPENQEGGESGSPEPILLKDVREIVRKVVSREYGRREQ